MKNCYALFIGIDHYTGDVPDLNGCQLDAVRMQKYIAQHINTDHYQLHSQLLVSEGEMPPTRHHIIEQIKVHLGQAKKSDYVLFFYAGHGSTEKAPAYFGETDDNFQTLVPQDARTQDPTTGLPIKNILDKELRYLFYQIWKEKRPQLIYIQDSCHSTGSNRLAEHQKQVQEVFTQTTALQQEHTLTQANQEIGLPIARYTMPTTDEKLLNQWKTNDSEQLQALYTGFDATIMPLLLNNIQTPLIAPADLLPLATQVHLAACGKQEYAYEVSPSGGVFTNTLLKVLHANGNNISYQQLLQRIKLSIGGAFEQSPSLFINDVDSTKIHQSFLGDLLRKKTNNGTTVGTDIFKGFFPVGYNKVRGWHISASEMMSLPRLSSQTIQQIPIEIFYQNSKPKGKTNANITQVNPQYSAFQFAASGQPPAIDDADKLVAMIPPQYTRRWRAKVAIDPSIPLSIFEDTFETKQLAKTMATGGRRKLMWVENLSQADYYVEQQGQWLALYAQTTNELIVRVADAIYLADEAEWVVTEKTAPSWQRWQNNTYTPIEDQTQLRIQDLPERASITLLRILLDLFDRTNSTTSLKIGYKLPSINQNSLEQFLEEEKRTATYFNHFINWKSFEEADYVVETGIDGWEVYPIESEEVNPLPLFAKTADFSKKSAFNLLTNLQKLTKWLTVQKLYNGLQAEKLGSLPLELKFTFYKDKQRTKSSTKTLSLAEKGSFDDYEKGNLHPLELIENEALQFVLGEPNFLQFDLDIQLGDYSLPIFYATLLLNDNYGIKPLQQDLGCHLLPPNQTALLSAIKINQPSQMRLFSASQSKAVYYLKLFVGFQRFDISGLLQEPLPPPTPPNRTRVTKKQYRGYQIQTPSTGEEPGMWASFVIPMIVK